MRAFAVILIILIVTITLHAEKPESLPNALPDLHSLFTDAVEVVEVGANRYFAPENSPYLFYSDFNKQAILRINRETWQLDSLSYPEGLWYLPMDSETQVLQQGNLLYVNAPRNPEVWTLNIETLGFTRYEPPCPQQNLTVDSLKAAWQSGWMLSYDDSGNRWSICDSHTGEISKELPDLNIISISPDGEWLLIHGDIDRDFRETFRIYGYEVNSGEQHYLGSMDNESVMNTYHYVWRWFGHRALLPLRDMTEWDTEYIYLVDVDRENSLKLAVSRYRFRAIEAYKDNPPRFDFTRGMEGGFTGQCTRVIYDILDDKTSEYDLKHLCFPDYGDPDGTGYYRDIDENAMMVRWNPFTKEQQPLFGSAEIEQVMWVSPDEHYAALVMDDSGYIDLPPWVTPFDPISPRNPRLALVDLNSDREIFSMSVAWRHSSFGSDASITQVADNRFIAISETENHQAILLEVEANGHLMQTPLMQGALFVIPQTGKILYHSPDSGMVMMAAPHEDGLPIMKLADDSSVSFSMEKNGLLNVNLVDGESGIEMNYRVRLK